MYKNSWNCSNGVGGGAGGSFLPPYRHPPPYACPRSSHQQQQPNNPIMCQCCGQFQPQQPHSLPPAQAWYQPQFQHPPPPHHLMMSTIPPNMAPLCPRAPNAQLGKIPKIDGPASKLLKCFSKNVICDYRYSVTTSEATKYANGSASPGSEYWLFKRLRDLASSVFPTTTAASHTTPSALFPS